MDDTRTVGFSTRHDDGGWTMFDLEGPKSKEMFDKAIDKALKLIELVFLNPDVASKRNEAVLVVAGLTARQQFAKHPISEIWRQNGCIGTEIIWTCDMQENQIMHP